MNYESGEKYQGEWFEDTQHGRGNLTYPNDVLFIGIWEHGERVSGSYSYKV